jgi:hypothetical protein
MTDTKEMLGTFSVSIPLGASEVAEAIDAALNCAQACTACADADLAEEDVERLRRCVALDQSCADICIVTARILSRPVQWNAYVVQRVLQACVRICQECAAECALHARHHRHCAICERACLACERACAALLDEDAFEELQKLAGG